MPFRWDLEEHTIMRELDLVSKFYFLNNIKMPFDI